MHVYYTQWAEVERPLVPNYGNLRMCIYSSL